ncbi:MAG: hypothetical protein NPIRA04_34230 [Nitrospirales bacterium]|nr:MAG: hypothetical protein NPIRA04_34230 [Nitrospirales bacterium]
MTLNENDIVARFVFGRHNIKRRENYHGTSEVVVQPKAFEPHPSKNDLSVFRISDLKARSDERSIWFIGKFVERDRQSNGSPSNMYGRADLSVFQIIDLHLEVLPFEPPPRHANIEKFPTFSTETDSECFQIQHKLADRAEGYLSKDVVPEITNVLNEDVTVRSEFIDGPNLT